MESAMFAHDYSIAYVTENVARATPGLYTFTAGWSVAISSKARSRQVASRESSALASSRLRWSPDSWIA